MTVSLRTQALMDQPLVASLACSVVPAQGTGSLPYSFVNAGPPAFGPWSVTRGLSATSC